MGKSKFYMGKKISLILGLSELSIFTQHVRPASGEEHMMEQPLLRACKAKEEMPPFKQETRIFTEIKYQPTPNLREKTS